MRLPAATLVSACALILLGGCGRGSTQADALDNAAKQADPAAAATMRNEADQIRATGNDAALGDPNSAAQQAMSDAGNAAARSDTAPAAKPAFGTHELVTPGPAPATPSRPGADNRAAQPHRAGEPVPNSTTPTPVTHHY